MNFRLLRSAGCALVLAYALHLHATVVGTSVAAPSLTQQRIDKLPKAQRGVWTAYLQRSALQEARDRGSLATEREGLATIPPVPQEGFGGGRSMPLDRDTAYYSTSEARHVGDVMVRFQTRGGGWSKNMSMSGALRLPGQSYAANNVSRYLGPDDFDIPRDKDWNYISTLDNNATSTEIQFLARLGTANPGPEGTP